MKASIDLGSNSALLLVMDGNDVVLDEAHVVGLGRGLVDGGPFRTDRMEAALAALAGFSQRAAELGVDPGDIVAIATSASRRASNAEEFYARVAAETGLRFRIVSGEEEARLTFLGSRVGEGEVAIIDLGGGSTEIALGDEELAWRHSFELGSVRLTEAVLGEDVRPATDADLEAMEELARIEVPRHAPAVGVAGTVTTLAAAALGLSEWDAAAVHGSVLPDTVLAGLQQQLLEKDAAQRRARFTVGAERADYLLAGATILRAALKALGQDVLRVSVRGLRYGALQ